MTWNLLHLARMLKDNNGIPAYGNQRSEWNMRLPIRLRESGIPLSAVHQRPWVAAHGWPSDSSLDDEATSASSRSATPRRRNSLVCSAFRSHALDMHGNRGQITEIPTNRPRSPLLILEGSFKYVCGHGSIPRIRTR